MSSNPLLVDLTEHQQPFDTQAMSTSFEASAHEDEQEAEAILHELDVLQKEFQLWAWARIKGTEERERDELVKESEGLREVERVQEMHRTKLASFMDAFKSAFKALVG